MKKIFHLFLCVILVFSTSANIVCAEAAGAASAKLVEVVYNTSGMNYSSPLKDSSTVFRPRFVDENDTEHTLYAFKTTRISYAAGDSAKAGSIRMGFENTNDSNINLYPENISSSTSVNSGKYTYTGKIYADKDVNSDGIADFSAGTFIVNRGQSYSKRITMPNDSLKANVWYEYEICVDLISTPSVFSVKYKEEGKDDYAFSATESFDEKSYSLIRIDHEYEAGTKDYYVWYKDFKYTVDTGVCKTQILSVNSDAMAEPNQNKLSFRLSEPVPALCENPGLVSVIDANGVYNAAQSLSVTSDGLTVNAVLSDNLYPWTNYTLKIDKSAYASYVHEETGEAVTDEGLSKVFSVAPTGFDMRDKNITSSADRVDFEMEITNVDSSCQDLLVLLPVFNSNGVMEAVEYKVPEELPVNGESKIFTLGASYAPQHTAKLFAATDWNNLSPLFGKYWLLGTIPSDASSTSAAEGITANDFDYIKNTIKLDINTGAGTQKTGVLAVYNAALPLGLSNLPIHIDYLTTASDGTLLQEIPFMDTLQNTTATYKVEFYYDEVNSPLSTEFTCHSPEDRLNLKRQSIFEAAISAGSVGLLRQAILGVDEYDNVVNDNYTVFSADADTSKYNILNNKTLVFVKMISSVNKLTNYTDLVSLFEKASQAVYNEENKPASSPSSDNKNYGSPSGSISSSSKPSAPNPDTVNPSEDNKDEEVHTVSFSDMKGHWAEAFAEKLSKLGIINGYPDGSFKGDNPVTRAELVKIISVAFTVPTGGDESFNDVDSNSWYAPYIYGAAKSGIVTGFENGDFMPDQSITRQDAVLMIYRAMKRLKDIKIGYVFFKDDSSIQDYAYDAVTSLAALNIIEGDDKSRFNPNNPITRAELAAVVSRAFDYMESH